MIFDTHAHYDAEQFDNDREELLAALRSCGIGGVIDPGCDLESSEKAMRIAQEHEFVYFAAGWHPEEAESFTEDDFSKLKTLFEHPRCIAAGEIGLDYYWDKTYAEKQKEILELQMAMAFDVNMPVIIHDREAHGDCLEFAKRYEGIKGVFHCFSGSAEMARELLKRGWYLGFDGPVTYKNARKTLEVLEICPPERILIETDSPYMSPVPMRGKRNDSRNLVYVIEKIAEIKGLTSEKTADITYENARQLFNIY